MAELPIIYTNRLDLTDEVRDEFEPWAAGKHIQDLLAAGFLSGLRFRSIQGDPEFLHLYQLPNVELLSTDRYKDVSKNDDTSDRFRYGVSNHSGGLYKQELAVNVTETPGSLGEGSTGDIKPTHLATVRMDVPQEESGEMVRWHREEHIPLMMAIPGVVTARLCRLTAHHPRNPCHEPEWISIYELESADVVRGSGVKAANETEWAKKVHAVTTGVRFNLMERIAPL